MTNADAHSGGTDAYGCHAGSRPYHCHGGGSSRSRSRSTTPSSSSSADRSTSPSTHGSESFGRTCSPYGETEPIRAEQEHNFYRNLWIHGSEIQSKVTLLEEPGSEQPSEAHGFVGDFAMASSRYFDSTCTAWIEVFDLNTGYTGWVTESLTSSQSHPGYDAIPEGQGYR